MNTSNTALMGIGRKIEALKPAVGTIANLACLAFPATFLFGTTALENTQVGYNRVTDTISELVWGTAGWIENVLFLVFAIALSIFALRIRTAFVPLAACAIGFVIIAVFPTEAPGSGQTIQSLIHQYSAQGIALALPTACFYLAHKLQSNEENRFVITCSLTAGVIGIILNFAGFLAIYGETGWVGGAERLVTLNGLIWLQIAGVHLWLLELQSRTVCCIDSGRTQSFTTIAAIPEAQEIRIKTDL